MLQQSKEILFHFGGERARISLHVHTKLIWLRKLTLHAFFLDLLNRVLRLCQFKLTAALPCKKTKSVGACWKILLVFDRCEGRDFSRALLI